MSKRSESGVRDYLESCKDRFEKRYLVFAIAVLVAIAALVFQHQIISGLAWMSGTQNLDVKDSRFGDNRNLTGIQAKKGIYNEEIEKLSEREYYVTQQNGTEPPFKNQYYDNERPGIYVDVVSGKPLFSSKHKFDSGTGWPSFYKPLEPENIIERKDPGPFGNRVEVASKHAKTHLGHIFRNPETPTGLRYCLNSASLEFIPAEKLEEKGYSQYAEDFDLN